MGWGQLRRLGLPTDTVSAHHLDHRLVWIVDLYLDLYKSVHSFEDMLKWEQEYVLPLDHISTGSLLHYLQSALQEDLISWNILFRERQNTKMPKTSLPKSSTVECVLFRKETEAFSCRQTFSFLIF